MKKAYCGKCGQTVKCAIKAVNLTTTVSGVDYYYIGQEARCTVCGEIIDMPEVNDFNAKAFSDEYQRKGNEIAQNCLNKSIAKPAYENSYEAFANLLKQHNVTPYRVAQGTGITQTTLSSWKHGKSTPNLDTFWKLAEFFQVNVDYFLNKDDYANNRAAINAAFERLKVALLEYDFDENDVDFLIDVYKAHKNQGNDRKKNNKNKR